MKKSLLSIVVSFAVIAMLSGCGPELAKTKYGPAETQWKDYISKSYREWEPPSTPPPMKGDEGSYQNQTTIEIVPEPSNISSSFPEISDKGSNSVQSLDSSNVELPTNYIVKKGDTLWSIAYNFYKNGRAWRAIQDANKDKLPTPDKLKAGMELTIPAPPVK